MGLLFVLIVENFSLFRILDLLVLLMLVVIWMIVFVGVFLDRVLSVRVGVFVIVVNFIVVVVVDWVKLLVMV